MESARKFLRRQLERTSSSSSDIGYDTLRRQMIPPTEAGLRSIDAAVCHALAESHHALLRFLTRRLGSREEAEERCITPESEAGGVRNSQLLRLSIS